MNGLIVRSDILVRVPTFFWDNPMSDSFKCAANSVALFTARLRLLDTWFVRSAQLKHRSNLSPLSPHKVVVR